MNFKEIVDAVDAPMRLWMASSGEYTLTIMCNGYGEYAVNCSDSEEGVLVGGPWDSFEEAEAACHRLVSQTH